MHRNCGLLMGVDGVESIWDAALERAGPAAPRPEAVRYAKPAAARRIIISSFIG